MSEWSSSDRQITSHGNAALISGVFVFKGGVNDDDLLIGGDDEFGGGVFDFAIDDNDDDNKLEDLDEKATGSDKPDTDNDALAKVNQPIVTKNKTASSSSCRRARKRRKCKKIVMQLKIGFSLNAKPLLINWRRTTTKQP